MFGGDAGGCQPRNYRYNYFMGVTQTIDVPSEVPIGKAILTFASVPEPCHLPLLPPPQRKRGLQQKPWQLQGNESPIPIASRFPAILESAKGF